MQLPFFIASGIAMLLIPGLSGAGVVRPAVAESALQVVRGHFRADIARAPLAGRLAPSQTLHLSIGLPLRNPAEAEAYVAAVSDPASPYYRRYLTEAQFESEFSPSARDYQEILAFARASNFTITRTYADHIVVSVDATAAAVERAFHLTMQVRVRPDGSAFYAPSNDPALALATPVLHIAGLDDARLPEPTLVARPIGQTRAPGPAAGSGPGGTFAGPDFRHAYASGTGLNGLNQCVGLLEFNSSFFPSDISSYETSFGLPALKPQKVLLDGYSGVPIVSNGEEETALDIEMALAMAPGLAHIFVYEGSNQDDIFAAMASPSSSGGTVCNQLSASWNFAVDATSQQLLDKMAMQGQSFYVSSGDSGGFTSDTNDDRDLSNLAVVGGTELSLDDNLQWNSEVAWPGSTGGLETSQYVPTFQHGVKAETAAGGISPLTSRGIPDVAAVASNVYLLADHGGQLSVQGTSVSSPLWAGFTALINEQANTVGQKPLGFPDPSLYTIAENPALYAANFHDIIIGNNGVFNAGPRYDLVTGWGSPTVKLITTLNPSPAKNFSQLQFVIYIGSDNLRQDSDLQVAFTGVNNLSRLCLMRSNNGSPTDACTGNLYGDINGTQGWPAWSTQTLTYINRFTDWKWSGAGTMTLKLTNHNNGLETNDNWDIQAMSVTLSNPAASTSVTLFDVGNFSAPHVSGNCYWRFKPSGSPPTVSQAFNLLPATTPGNGCPSDN